MKVHSNDNLTKTLTFEAGADVCIIIRALEKEATSKVRIVTHFLKKNEGVPEYLLAKTKELIQILEELLPGYENVIKTDIKSLKMELEQTISEWGGGGE